MARPSTGREKPISIRLPEALQERIKLAAEKMGLSDAEVIRLCVGVGLERLGRINYDLSGAICDSAEKAERAEKAQNANPGQERRKIA